MNEAFPLNPDYVMPGFHEQMRIERALREPLNALHRHVIDEMCQMVFRKRKAEQWVATRRLIELVK